MRRATLLLATWVGLLPLSLAISDVIGDFRVPEPAASPPTQPPFKQEFPRQPDPPPPHTSSADHPSSSRLPRNSVRKSLEDLTNSLLEQISEFLKDSRTGYVMDVPDRFVMRTSLGVALITTLTLIILVLLIAGIYLLRRKKPHTFKAICCCCKCRVEGKKELEALAKDLLKKKDKDKETKDKETKEDSKQPEVVVKEAENAFSESPATKGVKLLQEELDALRNQNSLLRDVSHAWEAAANLLNHSSNTPSLMSSPPVATGSPAAVPGPSASFPAYLPPKRTTTFFSPPVTSSPTRLTTTQQVQQAQQQQTQQAERDGLLSLALRLQRERDFFAQENEQLEEELHNEVGQRSSALVVADVHVDGDEGLINFSTTDEDPLQYLNAEQLARELAEQEEARKEQEKLRRAQLHYHKEQQRLEQEVQERARLQRERDEELRKGQREMARQQQALIVAKEREKAQKMQILINRQHEINARLHAQRSPEAEEIVVQVDPLPHSTSNTPSAVLEIKPFHDGWRATNVNETLGSPVHSPGSARLNKTSDSVVINTDADNDVSNVSRFGGLVSLFTSKFFPNQAVQEVTDSSDRSTDRTVINREREGRRSSSYAAALVNSQPQPTARSTTMLSPVSAVFSPSILPPSNTTPVSRLSRPQRKATAEARASGYYQTLNRRGH